jgi:hypothetical protein
VPSSTQGDEVDTRPQLRQIVEASHGTARRSGDQARDEQAQAIKHQGCSVGTVATAAVLRDLRQRRTSRLQETHRALLGTDRAHEPRHQSCDPEAGNERDGGVREGREVVRVASLKREQ